MRFLITLEGLDDAQPVVVRVRQALKLLGRAFRLKCVAIETADGGPVLRAVGHDDPESGDPQFQKEVT
jgi:hypothetical protein